MKQSYNYGIVKFGLSKEDNNVYLRADLYKAGTNTALLKRVIQQVANITDIIGGNLKKATKLAMFNRGHIGKI